MKLAEIISRNLPVTIRNLSITTKLRLHPEFVRAPLSFARRNRVELADEVRILTHFKKDPEHPGSSERIKKPSSNIPLVRRGAIRLYAKPDGDDWLVHSIKVNPAMLLCEAEKHRLRAGDLRLSLSMLKDAVSPILAEPIDARHIVPGLEADREPVAFWSKVDSELLLPGVAVQSLHRLSHPLTGPAEGVKKTRIQLGDEEDDCWIRLKAAKWQFDGPEGMQTIEGVRVRLCLRGHVLVNEFREFDTIAKVGDTPRLVDLTERSMASVHQAVLTLLDGLHMPVPSAWLDSVAEGRKDRVTHAKAMALASRLTSIPLKEIRAMDEEIRQPSESTRDRLDKDLPLEFGRLNPVPVASLFGPSVYASRSSGISASAEDVDPAIADLYGEGTAHQQIENEQ